MIDDLKQIKKYYGENMMHLCRELFSTILETPGLLFRLISNNFNYYRYLYDDIIENQLEEEFKNYIYSLVDVDKKEVTIEKTPYELLKEAGYNLYECKTEEDIQSFKKYYSKGEELCTFWGGRLNRCHVFFAVKENVNEIKREDFQNPQRQDEYGTSVISIQFTRGNINTLSIKNRYNHTVNNPDATFSNNLENIIEGLTASFEKEYGLNINQSNAISFEIPGYVIANDRKYYKYNYEINNIYYCPDNIIIDNYQVISKYQEKEKYLIMDYFILDLINKEVNIYDKRLEDSFIDGLKNINKIRINKEKETGNKQILIIPKKGKLIRIKIDKYNNIIGYKNENIIEIGDCFIYYNKILENIELEKVKKIGNAFLANNIILTSINFPELIEVGNGFLYKNRKMKNVNFPNLVKIEDKFLYYNSSLKYLVLPKLKEVGSSFMDANNSIKQCLLPSLEIVGDCFLFSNISLKNVNFPNLKEVGTHFLCCYYTMYSDYSDYFLTEESLNSLELIEKGRVIK